MSRPAADAMSVGRPLATLVLAAALVAGCGAEPEREAASRAAEATATPTPAATEAAMAPLPESRPQLVTPQAGKASGDPTDDLPGVSADDTSLPKPKGPASDSEVTGSRNPAARNLSATTAVALPNGVAIPPLEAPEAVLNVIRAGNIIARSPYKWGGGHGRFQDNGYDCSGSVSYALYYAGLIDGPHVSGEYMSYGEPGPGKWITIYANPGHMYMVVAGIRFDTVGRAETGSRWQNETAGSPGNYAVRHPAGL